MVLESKRLRISRTKIEYLKWNFSGKEQKSDKDVTIVQVVVPCTTSLNIQDL